MTLEDKIVHIRNFANITEILNKSSKGNKWSVLDLREIGRMFLHLTEEYPVLKMLFGDAMDILEEINESGTDGPHRRIEAVLIVIFNFEEMYSYLEMLE